MRKTNGTEEISMKATYAGRARSWRRIGTAFLLTISATITSGGLATDEAKQLDLIRAVSKGTNQPPSTLDYDTSLLKELEVASEAGDAHAERLMADALVKGKKGVISKDSARAKALYQSAASKGLAEGFLGEAEIALEQITPGGVVPENVIILLEEASSRGIAKADRLLSKTISEYSTDAGVLNTGWQLLNRAAQRKDPYALLEVGDALLEGSWKTLSIEADPELAEEYFREATKQGIPEAALRMSRHIMRVHLEDKAPEKEEATRFLYLAYKWAYEKNPALIEEMDRMHQEGELQPAVWIRARGLFESSLEPSVGDVSVDKPIPFRGKVRHGKMTYLKIEGAVSDKELTYSLLGFPLDAFYIWEGTFSEMQSDSITIARNDAYWNRAVQRSAKVLTPYFLKVLDGPYAGLTVTIPDGWVPHNNRRIELEEDVSSILSGDETVALGCWRSLFSVFGQYNEVGLRPGTSAQDGDQVILLNSEFQTQERFFFNKRLMTWSANSDPDKAASDVIIPPWQGVIVLRRDAAPLYMQVDGSKTNYAVSVPVDPGVNLLTNVQYKLLLDELNTAHLEKGIVAASSIPVFRLEMNREDQLGFERIKKPTNWWELLGIGPEDPIYLNRGSIFILTEDTEASPYLLQW